MIQGKKTHNISTLSYTEHSKYTVMSKPTKGCGAFLLESTQKMQLQDWNCSSLLHSSQEKIL